MVEGESGSRRSRQGKEKGNGEWRWNKSNEFRESVVENLPLSPPEVYKEVTRYQLQQPPPLHYDYINSTNLMSGTV